MIYFVEFGNNVHHMRVSSDLRRHVSMVGWLFLQPIIPSYFLHDECRVNGGTVGIKLYCICSLCHRVDIVNNSVVYAYCKHSDRQRFGNSLLASISILYHVIFCSNAVDYQNLSFYFIVLVLGLI